MNASFVEKTAYTCKSCMKMNVYRYFVGLLYVLVFKCLFLYNLFQGLLGALSVRNSSTEQTYDIKTVSEAIVHTRS